MKYTGGCHCQKVRYEIEMEIETLLACNCSYCHKTNHRLAFAPESQFKLLSGKDSLSDYQFGKKTIHHYFCSHCGISSFGTGKMPDGTAMCAINVLCLDNYDEADAPVEHFDGKSL